MRLARCFPSLVAVLAFLLTVEPRAYAYTDPGSGALLWQALVAAFVGAGFYFRKFLFHLIPKKKIEKEAAKDDAA
jgi:hypothetical protein